MHGSTRQTFAMAMGALALGCAAGCADGTIEIDVITPESAVEASVFLWRGECDAPPEVRMRLEERSAPLSPGTWAIAVEGIDRDCRRLAGCVEVDLPSESPIVLPFARYEDTCRSVDQVCIDRECRDGPVVYAGDRFGCSASADGATQCWGGDDDGMRPGSGASRFQGEQCPLAESQLLAIRPTGGCAIQSIQTLREAARCWRSEPFYEPVGDVRGDSEEALVCWGSRDRGQTGTYVRYTEPENRVRPVPLEVESVVALGCAEQFCCFATDQNPDRLECVGSMGLPSEDSPIAMGPDGIEILPDAPRRSFFVALAGVEALDGGTAFVCAIHANGDVSCFGDNRMGQLGGPPDEMGVARRVLTNVVLLSAYADHVCALDEAGEVWCWGGGGLGQLGVGPTAELESCTGTNDCARTPRRMIDGSGRPLMGVRAIATGSDATCVVDAEGHIRCTGSNAMGQLGVGRTSEIPVDIVGDPVTAPDLGTPDDLVGGAQFFCASRDAGVWCWGSNDTGRTAQGCECTVSVPTRVRTSAPVSTCDECP